MPAAVRLVVVGGVFAATLLPGSGVVQLVVVAPVAGMLAAAVVAAELVLVEPEAVVAVVAAVAAPVAPVAVVAVVGEGLQEA